MKTKIFALLVFLFILTSSGYSQDYNSAVGLRFGSPTSITYKKFISGNSALEGFAGFRSYGFGSSFNLSGLYLIHNDISSVSGLKWYYGGGAGAYFYSYNVGFVNDGGVGLGILGALGLDYKFADAPINLSIDWVPTFFLGGGSSGFTGESGALSARYVLN